MGKKITDFNFINLVKIINDEDKYHPEYIICFQKYLRMKGSFSYGEYSEIIEDRPGRVSFNHITPGKRFYSNHLLVQTDHAFFERTSRHRKIILIQDCIFFDSMLLIRIAPVGLYRFNIIDGPIKIPMNRNDYYHMMTKRIEYINN